ncbi:MAG TPA: FtsX-like permease family protein [Firmicutes bacterium]|nr:FtsX-like permease family protein [Bacillota bacterium]
MIFPLNYMRFYRAGRERYYSDIFIKATPGQIHAAVGDAQFLLAPRLEDGAEVRGEYFSDTNRFFAEQIRNISLFLGAFAFIAILISSIGILSIMLVSVVERTREIGLRKALGASKGTIVSQVLNESFVFSILGSLVGLLAASLSARPFLNILAQDLVSPRLSDLGGLHPLAALLAFALTVAAGQIFSLYPALQAAGLVPVDALREI